MTRNSHAFASLAAVFGWLSVATTVGAVERQVADRIAAVIEDEIITVRELEQKAGPYLAKLDEIQEPAQRSAKRSEILRRVLDIEIGERIVNAEIERSKDRLGVDDKDVDRAIQEVMSSNNLTEEQLQAALYAQGVAWSEYRQKLRAQIERARLIQFQVQGKIQLRDEDVRRRCHERQAGGAVELKVCAAHILRVIPDAAEAAVTDRLFARMSQLQAELVQGADFSAYALKHSDDKGAPDGDLGCFGRGEMVAPFEQAAYALQVGQVSPVVKTSFGLHIIKVYDRRAASTASCDSDQMLEAFRNEIYQEEMERHMNAWLGELRRTAFVEVRI
jgi:parvulin-like peptidyl-prolyl isomerase